MPLAAPTKHLRLLAWVEEMAHLTEPDQVVWCDGSQAEYDRMFELMLASGTAERLAPAHRPNSYLVLSENGRPSTYTSVQDVARFDHETGVDAIAISAGNIHLNQETNSEINMAAIRAIEAVTTRPLVIHGGSGIAPETRRQLAQETRIKKFNIGTELRMAFGAALRKSIAENPAEFDRNVLLSNTVPALRAATITTLRSVGRSQF